MLANNRDNGILGPNQYLPGEIDYFRNMIPFGSSINLCQW